MAGGAERAVELTNPDYQLLAPGATFAGRDVFAPAAAHICNGVELERARPRGRHGVAAAGDRPAAAGGRRRDRRRGAVGRPLRQLPTQRRARRPAGGVDRRRPVADRLAHRADRRCDAPRRTRRAASPPSAPVSLASCSTRTGCWRSASTGARRPRSSASSPATRCCSPALEDPQPGCHRGVLRAPPRRPVASSAMRPATTLTLGLLLAAILIAGIISLVRL